MSAQTAASRPDPLWTRPEARAVLGETLRPGDFALTDRAVEALDLRPGMSALDAGCGTGATVRRLRRRFGLHALGIDLCPAPPAANSLALAPGLASGLVQSRIDALPLRNHCLDAVFCECVLSLQMDPKGVLAEFHRVLAPGGGLALSDLYRPDPTSPGEKRTDFPATEPPPSCAQGALPRARLLALLTKAGFRVSRFEDHTPLLRELAARLAWAGCATPCCGPGCGVEPVPGYFLLIATKPENDHA
ncbi:MAG: DVU_1556 family methyltransferase [Desulfovibrio sp.]